MIACRNMSILRLSEPKKLQTAQHAKNIWQLRVFSLLFYIESSLVGAQEKKKDNSFLFAAPKTISSDIVKQKPGKNVED